MKKISDLHRNELMKLLNGLKLLSQENKAYIEAFLNQARSEPSMRRYKQMISRSLEFDELCVSDYNLDKMRHHLKSFFKASTNKLARAELMVYAVEAGCRLTIEWGDMGEYFYDFMYDLFKEMLQTIAVLPDKEDGKSVLIERIKKLIFKLEDVGYGFQDDIGDAFYEYFGRYD
jgi:hypothetical protein